MKKQIYTWLSNPVIQFYLVLIAALIYCDLMNRY